MSIDFMKVRSRPLGRRQFLAGTAAGLAAGGLGLRPALSLAAELGGASALAPRPSHFPARAQNLIFVFLTGGFSHLDTFDPKPKLSADDGKKVAAPSLRITETLPLLGSPYAFARHGASGLWVSELFPELATLADELCVIRSLHTDIVEHF